MWNIKETVCAQFNEFECDPVEMQMNVDVAKGVMDAACAPPPANHTVPMINNDQWVLELMN